MKILRMHFNQWAVLLIIGLAVTGYPHHGQAMSLFMGGEEPKPAPPPAKPAVAKPQPAPGQPGAKATGPAPTGPATGAPAQTGAGTPVPAAPVAGAPKPVGTQPAPPTGASGQPSPGSSAPPPATAPKPVTAQPSATLAVPAPPAQATRTAKEPLKPAASAGAPATPMAASASTPAPAEPAEGYAYDPKSRRDPFQSLTRMVKIDKTRPDMPPLQRVQISDLKLLGIMWGGYGYYGLVQTPDGKGYTVKEGMLMGTNNGVITTITDKAIIVSEPSIDISGNKSTKDLEILLRPKEVS